jgi:archaemetzincin
MDYKNKGKIVLAYVNQHERVIDNKMVGVLKAVFKRDVIISRKTDLNIEKYYNVTRNQYHSTEILKTCIKDNLKSENKIVLITDVDLYIPILTFVFGEAHMFGQYSIVSTTRLYESFYHRENNIELLKQRLLKEVIHELLHCFGLTHCVDDLCVMHSSTTIEDTDRKSIYPCRNCFDILDNLL